MSTFALVSAGQVISLQPAQFSVSPPWSWADVSAVSPTPGIGWSAVQNGGAWTFTPPVDHTPDMARTASRAAAQAALEASDVTLLRCFEHGIAVTDDWRAYRAALRATVAGTAAMPTRPAYPAGT